MHLVHGNALKFGVIRPTKDDPKSAGFEKATTTYVFDLYIYCWIVEKVGFLKYLSSRQFWIICIR